MRIYVWLAAATACTLSLLATWKGPGLSVDSITYLSTGVNLAESGTLVTWNGQPLTVFPPGLPIVGALGTRLGVDPETAVRLFEAACAAGVVILTNALLRKASLSRSLLVGATWLTAVSPTLLGITMMAWTEPPFVVSSLFLMIMLCKVYEKGKLECLDALALMLICWAAFAFRYAGIALILVSAAALVAAPLPRTASSLFRISAVTSLAFLFPAGWMLRNMTLDESLLGPRFASHENLKGVAISIARTVGGWVLPRAAPAICMIAVGIFLLVGLGLVVIFGVNPPQLNSTQAETQRRSVLVTAATFVVFYTTYLVFAELSTNLDPVNSRLMSPVYVPMLAIGMFSLDFLLIWQCLLLRQRRRVIWITIQLAVPLVLALFIASQFIHSARDTYKAMLSGVGFNSNQWRESDLAEQAGAFLEKFPSLVFTNDVEGLWAATRIQPIHRAPVRREGAKDNGPLDAFGSAVGCASPRRPVVLAVFNAGDNRRMYPVREIERVVNLNIIRVAQDGIFFSVEPRGNRQSLSNCAADIVYSDRVPSG